ncbi:uncharacterized protein A1O9_01659 [Exophiala aquamarina CBS 119918]|uniref:Amidase domain-containing protein n=1 Tax=Exophiala aquamarina CBS 119918 TaxID=1182545 RepID=A0A072PV01_9EURO|nr:uncharacterized protein A1O9_01659 [Exophiala aquamarina CBS 119918]KEF63681.1 hypothetical protein A1O9_01659 [Exophiala aquamarina CBS 119918]
MGYVGWIGTFEGKKGTGKEKKVFESELVRELRNMGAIMYCKTSLSHTLKAGETINNIIGYASSPRNWILSAGGSSGGEGALLPLRGSSLGRGTDMGGSKAWKIRLSWLRRSGQHIGLFGLGISSDTC